MIYYYIEEIFRMEEEIMEKKLEVRKNLPYSLEVWERNERSLIGSDMEPIKLGDWDEEFTAWDSSYIAGIVTHSFWLVRQEGKPIVIEQTIEGKDNFWEAYELPKLTEVLLNKDIEEK